MDTNKFVVPFGDALLLTCMQKTKRISFHAYNALKKAGGDFDVYLAEEIPTRWNYSKQDDRYNRVGDILLVPRLPKVFNLSSKPTTPGKHGFDNALFDMHASFYAWGPAFKTHLQIPSFENVHVFPLVAPNCWGLAHLSFPIDSIDGRAAILDVYLREY